MKKKFYFIVFLIFLVLNLSGCSKEEESVSLELWHYYNGAQKIAFDELVENFNETLGLEKGIMLESFSQGNISQLEEKIINSVENKVGSSDVPNIVAIYPEIGYALDQREMVVDLTKYLSDIEINQYVDSYIEEGQLGNDNKFIIFPTAKATEIMMINKTDWDKFAEATGSKISDLDTWEGIRSTGELYYKWTDNLTDEKNDGKAFFGRDALANYILVGSKQLGKEIFEVKEDEIIVNLDPDIIRRLWDNYYIPYISGYYSSKGRFSTDDAKIGDIIALVGSTTGATYFPENVTIGNNPSYDINLLVLPLPNFKNTSLNAVQQGAGMSVIKSDTRHEKASVEFLKWFTEEDRNLDFSINTGYLPVKKTAYNIESFKLKLEEEKNQGLSKKLQDTLPKAMEQMGSYNLHFNKAFEQGGESRKILELALDGKSKEDREKFLSLMEDGLSHQEVVSKFATDENFENWFLKLESSLMGVVER